MLPHSSSSRATRALAISEASIDCPARAVASSPAIRMEHAHIGPSKTDASSASSRSRRARRCSCQTVSKAPPGRGLSPRYPSRLEPSVARNARSAGASHRANSRGTDRPASRASAIATSPAMGSVGHLPLALTCPPFPNRSRTRSQPAARSRNGPPLRTSTRTRGSGASLPTATGRCIACSPFFTSLSLQLACLRASRQRSEPLPSQTLMSTSVYMEIQPVN